MVHLCWNLIFKPLVAQHLGATLSNHFCLHSTAISKLETLTLHLRVLSKQAILSIASGKIKSLNYHFLMNTLNTNLSPRILAFTMKHPSKSTIDTEINLFEFLKIEHLVCTCFWNYLFFPSPLSKTGPGHYYLLVSNSSKWVPHLPLCSVQPILETETGNYTTLLCKIFQFVSFLKRQKLLTQTTQTPLSSF